MDKTAINALADKYDADIMGYFGDIQKPEDDWLYRVAPKRKLRTNVILALTTRGGDPHVAYRISRALQDFYNTCPAKAGPTPTNKATPPQGKFIVVLLSKCKSAGTITALGASEIWMSKGAELGPIDVQLRKPDEVGERTSGLTPIQAMSVLENQSLSMFKRHFQQLRFDAELVFSTKMAAEVATAASVGLLSSIFSQIDPMRLAEVDRSMRISADYGERLASGNLMDGALQRLLAKYPAHGFVIDRREAEEEIFKNIKDPPDDFSEFVEFWATFGNLFLERDDTYFYWLSDEPAAVAAANDPAEESTVPTEAKAAAKPVAAKEKTA